MDEELNFDYPELDWGGGNVSRPGDSYYTGDYENEDAIEEEEEIPDGIDTYAYEDEEAEENVTWATKIGNAQTGEELANAVADAILDIGSGVDDNPTLIVITAAEYESLSEAEKNSDSKIYFVT